MTTDQPTLSPTVSTLRRMAATRPVTLATTASVVFAVALLCWPLLFPRADLRPATAGWGLWGVNVTRVLLPAVALTALGWWRHAGFTRPVTWSTLWPSLPLVLFIVLNLVSGSGSWVSDPATLAIAAVTMLALGFGEEATFRGVVLRVLQPIGLMRAAVLSALLFGAFHLVNLSLGSSPVDVGFQVLYTALIGFTFAATALVTGAIWPLILIHAAMDLANAVQAGVPLAAASTTSPDLASRFLAAVPNALLAAYGYWLLRRHLAHQPQPSASRDIDRAASHRRNRLVGALTTLALALVTAGVTVTLLGALERGAGLALSGIVMALFALAATRMTRMPQLRVEPDGDELVVRFAGWDALWTLRREARVRTADLTDVGTIPVAGLHRRPWPLKLRGTMLPGVIEAGSFIDADGRQLWDVRATGNALLLDLGPDAPYRRMVLQVPDPDRTSARLRPLPPA